MRDTRRQPWWWWPLVILHLALVVDVALQPLATEAGRRSHRALIWPLHNDSIHRIGPGADFFAVYHAGQALAAGLDPYEATEIPRRTPYWFDFRYLPIVGSTLGRVACAFPPRIAYLLWIVANELALWSVVLLVYRRAPVTWHRTMVLIVLLLNSPYLLELHMGQFTLVTVAAVALAMLLVHADPNAPEPPRLERVAGALAYAGAALLKIFPIATIPALVRDRRYRAVLAVTTSALVVAAWHDFAHEPSRLRTFWELNFSHPVGGMDSGNFGIVYAGYLTMRWLWPTWLHSHWTTVMVAWRGLVLGITALCVLTSRADDARRGVVLLLLAHFVSYVHVWEHHASGILVLGCLLLLLEQRHDVDEQHDGRWKVAIVAASLVLLAMPTPFVFFDRARDPRVLDPSAAWPFTARLAVVLCKALPTAALFGIALWRQLERGFAAPWMQRPQSRASNSV